MKRKIKVSSGRYNYWKGEPIDMMPTSKVKKLAKRKDGYGNYARTVLRWEKEGREADKRIKKQKMKSNIKPFNELP